MTKQKIMADLASLAGGAVGVVSSLRQQLKEELRDRFDTLSDRMDLVTRDDLDRLEGMIAKLRVRLDALEAKDKSAGRAPKAAKPKPRAKPAKTRRK